MEHVQAQKDELVQMFKQTETVNSAKGVGETLGKILSTVIFGWPPKPDTPKFLN